MASLRARSISIKRIIEDVMDSFNQEAEKKTHHTCVPIRAKTIWWWKAMLPKFPSPSAMWSRTHSTSPTRAGMCLVAAEQIPGYIKVSVIDDGIGIPAKDLSHIFERFYQVESHLTRKHGGMGLGLSVAKVMTELHGGRIWAESVEGKGSNFTILLPVNPEQADAASRVLCLLNPWNPLSSSPVDCAVIICCPRQAVR